MPNVFDRTLKFNLLKYVIRPFKKVENYDVVKTTELKLDHTISGVFKQYLNQTGLQSCWLTTSFGQMHYYDSEPESNKPPLIFLHGLGCSAQNFWILGKMFQNKRRVIMPDLFHMGGFSRAKVSTMTISNHCASIKELCQSVSSGKPDMCASSMGGWIALLLAANDQNIFKNLILMNPTGTILKMRELGHSILNLTWREFKFLYPGILKAFPYNGFPVFSSAARRGAYRNLKKTQVVDLLRTVTRDDCIDDIVSKIECPVLLIWGNDDQFVSPQMPRILMKKIKNIQGIQIENCAHGPQLEAPAACFQEINHFLNLMCIEENNFTKIWMTLGKPHKVNPIQFLNNRIDNDN